MSSSPLTARPPLFVSTRGNALPSHLDDKRYLWLAALNATAADYPHHRCIHELFEEQVARTPTAPAVIHGMDTVTYAELNRRANILARRLRELGVGHETLVGLLMERSIEQLVSVLAILKAGAAYVPLDPAHPRERLALMIADTAAPVLVVQRQLLSLIPPCDAAILCADDEFAPEPGDEANLAPVASPDSLAYVIYTSGSTGVPKGVLIDHRGLVNHTAAMVTSHALTAEDRVLQFSSLSFDASAASLYPALVTGACLILPEYALAELVGDQLTRLCEEQRISVIQLPASVWHQWVDDMLARGRMLRAPVRVLLVGGEPPLVEKLRAWIGLANRPMIFLNAYGPTEAAITTTLFSAPCDEETAAGLDAVPIGRPIANKQIYLLDPELRPVPAGEVGELYVGGVGLARGYLNRPELTAERFISWAPEATPGMPALAPQRLYRSGDLARLRDDGNIDFLGRIDDQVKLRGFRIELGEIAAALRRHPAVREAVVLVREDEPGAQQLVAYLVLDERSRQAEELLWAELRANLRASLPAYMVPSSFIELQQLPLNVNGKLDRAALPAPGVDRRETGWSAPANSDELMIGRLWAQALGRDHIRIHDDFFELGGHSLAAARAVALVNMAFGCDLPLRLMYEAPSVAAFARAMRAGATKAGVLSAAALAAEVALDPQIRPRGQVGAMAEPRAIFLTGSTGYLGAFLLRELLDRTDATIYCLVRASHQQEALDRLADVAATYRLRHDDLPGRVAPILGDLRRPMFGLSRQAFERLAGSVDRIYHAGAQVHYLYPYAALKDANVGGTAEVLRLATIGSPKPVHYVSTLSTAIRATGEATAYEDDPLAPCDSARGYDQSKWVAEGLIRLAGERGLPVAIYRPGRIGSHSRTGAFNDGDFFVRLLASCLQLGQAPDIDMLENLLPVDGAAQAILQLARQAPPTQGATTFHLMNEKHTRWRWVVEQTAALGYSLDLVPYADWRAAFERAVASDPDRLLLGQLPYLPLDMGEADTIDVLARQRFDTRRATAGLAGLPIQVFDREQLALLLAEGGRRGVFPAPTARQSPHADPISVEHERVQ